MVYNDTATRLGLIQECESLTGLGKLGISGDTDKLADFTRWINESYFKVTGAIIKTDGRWQWDDSNQTNQPVATTDLVSGQRDYGVIAAAPTSTQDWLEVDRVEMIDNAGNNVIIHPFDKRDIKVSIDELYETDNIPQFYDFEGGSIKLYPSPNYDSSDGLKIWFKRAPLLFASTDTTKKPGFASIYHRILAYEASMSYLLTKDMGRWTSIKALADQMNLEIKKHYNKRDKYEIPRIGRSTGKLMR